MRFIIFLFLLLSTFLFSQELVLDDLLNEYEDSESLYKETKQESAGFLLVYSREDLEKMQAFSLKDVLKTVRVYTTNLQNVGVTRLQKVGSGRAALTPIKLYIDNYEVTTVAQGNALDMYGEMDIYFVDHIEIYQGGSSIAFGNSPGSMVIRLYSKDPSKENSSSVQLSADSKASGDLRAVTAGTYKEYDYLFYADGAKTNYDKYTRNAQELSRDGQRYQAHFKVAKKADFEIAVDAIASKTDIFNGMGTAPLGDESERDYAYIDVIKYFDGGIKLSASASMEVKKFQNSDAIGIQLYTDAPNTPTGNNVNVVVNSNTYKIILNKKMIIANHDLLIGAQFQQNKLDVKKYETVNFTPFIGPKKLDIYMLYLEEMYNINENHLLTFSGKLDHYRNSFGKNSTEYALRLGYIALLSNDWSTKLFAIRRYTYPNMLETTFAPPTYKPNPNLESSYIDMYTGELEYNDGKHRAVFGYAYKIIDDGIAFDKIKKQYINKTETVKFSRIYVRGEHKFDYDNKFVIEYFKGFLDKSYSPTAGVLFQSFNTLAGFDIYNELVYRNGYTLNYGAGDVKIDDGYDYTLSVAYQLNRNLGVKVKGENLLDKASKTLIDNQGFIQAPAVERRGVLTMEYTF